MKSRKRLWSVMVVLLLAGMILVPLGTNAYTIGVKPYDPNCIDPDYIISDTPSSESDNRQTPEIPVNEETDSSVSATTSNTYVQNYWAKMPAYKSHEQPIIDSYRSLYNQSKAQALVGRAIWYMEYGFMIYGHTKYATSGLIDCSNFVSLVYRDFGYTITSAARNYGSVGIKVEGVYSARKPGTTSQYMLVGVDKLKPGDIFTYWNTDSTGQRYISHVALYMGVVNGKPCIIQTIKGRPTAIGITNSFSYWYGQHFLEARRVLPASSQEPGSFGQLPGPVIPAVYKLPPQCPIVLPSSLNTGF